MITRKPGRTLEFSEHDEAFIIKLAKDIGCHYCKANVRTYSLQKAVAGSMDGTGVFAWVHKEDVDYFWISTRKVWVEEARAKVLTARRKPKSNIFVRDTQHAEDSVCFNTKFDYLNTVRVLSLINKAH